MKRIIRILVIYFGLYILFGLASFIVLLLLSIALTPLMLDKQSELGAMGMGIVILYMVYSISFHIISPILLIVCYKWQKSKDKITNTNLSE